MARRSERIEQGRSRIRCAIYTRKSTEEGLDQEFNSLDAQREACAAYILSQQHEGWVLSPDYYDDGGFSGGNMDRPALKQLLADVSSGKVDVIVVYKVDRLTRSLADFAKIVEVLDAKGASFVSVTQAFNTTTSMGRLTLNVLLSFAQFEREVTGERIRDKIAASKRKGMWMGGVVPLGYEVRDRKLVINDTEAEIVRMIFQRYIELGSVMALKEQLAELGIRTRQRLSRNGRTYGGVPLGMGALYTLLQNRIYLGEISHKGSIYPGEHDAILEPDLFEQAQRLLERNRIARLHGENADEPSLLAGTIRDGHGRRMTPNHACKKGRRYRYYVSRIENTADKVHPTIRVPANELEGLVISKLARWLQDKAAIRDALIERPAGALVEILKRSTNDALALETAMPARQRELLLSYVQAIEVGAECISITVCLPDAHGIATTLTVPANIVRAGKQVRLALPPGEQDGLTFRDPGLIKLITKAHQVRTQLMASNNASLDEAAERQGITKNYLCRLLRLSYLAPDIIAAILDGQQPASLTRQKLARLPELPIEWNEQRQVLGFV